MKITFGIDLVDSWRNGINVPSPIACLEADPSMLSTEQRELIGKHLLATDDGCTVVYDPERAKPSDEVVPIGGHPGADLIKAKKPTVESLVEALAELERQTIYRPKPTHFCAQLEI